MDFEIWHIWFIATILFFLLEIFLPSFVAACIGVGTLAAGIIAFAGMNLEIQLLVFALSTLLAVFLIRPFMLKYAHKRSDNTPTNVDAIIGRVGKVSETVGPNLHMGRVILDGDNWKAKSETGAEIQENAEVIVTKIESIILTVKPLSE